MHIYVTLYEKGRAYLGIYILYNVLCMYNNSIYIYIYLGIYIFLNRSCLFYILFYLGIYLYYIIYNTCIIVTHIYFLIDPDLCTQCF